MRRTLLPAILLAIATPLHASGDGGHSHGAHAHAHDTLREVPAGEVSLHAERDPLGGWNVEVRTEAFRFVPEKVNGEHVDGEGHAHIYIDGEKLRRIYGPWFHLPALGPGAHELKVTLNGHAHDQLAVDGEPLVARTTLREE